MREEGWANASFLGEVGGPLEGKMVLLRRQRLKSRADGVTSALSRLMSKIRGLASSADLPGLRP